MICHYREYNELYLVSRGKAKIVNAGEEWYVQARDIACIDAGDEHDILEVYGDEDFELFRPYEPEPDGARLGHLHHSPEKTEPHPSGEAVRLEFPG